MSSISFSVMCPLSQVSLVKSMRPFLMRRTIYLDIACSKLSSLRIAYLKQENQLSNDHEPLADSPLVLKQRAAPLAPRSVRSSHTGNFEVNQSHFRPRLLALLK